MARNLVVMLLLRRHIASSSSSKTIASSSKSSAPAARLLRYTEARPQQHSPQSLQNRTQQQSQDSNVGPSTAAVAATTQLPRYMDQVREEPARASSSTTVTTSRASSIIASVDKVVQLRDNVATSTSHFFAHLIESRRVSSRRDIAAVLRTSRDFWCFVPTAFAFSLPFVQRIAVMPLLFSYAPRAVSSVFLDAERLIVRRTFMQRRRKAVSKRIVASFASAMDVAAASGDVVAQSHVQRLKTMMADEGLLTYGTITHSAELFKTSLSAITPSLNVADHLRLTGHTLPSILPRARILRWADWILTDDALIRNAGPNSLNAFEVLEALEDRGFVNLHDMTVAAQRAALIEHVKFSKSLAEALVRIRREEKTAACTIDEDGVATEVIPRGDLRAHEIAAAASALIFARAHRINQ